MATWQDGPEYAPLERPAGFDVPPVPHLDAPVSRERPRVDGPAERPKFEQRDSVEPLERIGAISPTEERDPRAAFQVMRSVMTPPSTMVVPIPAPEAAQPSPTNPGTPTGLAGSAWSAVHGRPLPQPSWSPPIGPPAGGGRSIEQLPPHPAPRPIPQAGPQQPPFPAPGSNQWFGPGAPSRPPHPRGRLGFAAFLDGIDPFVFAALVLGGTITPISPLMFILAMMLCARVKYRQTWVRNTFWLGAATVFTTLILSVAVSAGDFEQWYAILSRLSMIVCLGVLAVVSILVTLALTNGEPPESDRRNYPGTR